MKLQKLYWENLRYGQVEFQLGFFKFSAWIPKHPAPLRVAVWLESPWENEEDSLGRGGWQLIKPAKDWKKNPNVEKEGVFPVVIFEGMSVMRTSGRHKGSKRIVYRSVGIAHRKASGFGYKTRVEKNGEVVLHEISIIGRGDKIRSYQWIKEVSKREERKVEEEKREIEPAAVAELMREAIKRTGKCWTAREIRKKIGVMVGENKWKKAKTLFTAECGEVESGKVGFRKVKKGNEWVFWYDGERNGVVSTEYLLDGTQRKVKEVTFEDGHKEVVLSSESGQWEGKVKIVE